MRIGIYDPYLDDLGGGEKYMMTIAEALSRKHDVSVFWDEKKDLHDLLQRFSLDLDKVKLAPNIFASTVGFFDRLKESKQYDVIIVLSDGSIPFVFSKKLLLHVQQPLEHLTRLSLKNKVKLARVRGIFYNSQFTQSFNKKLLSGARSTVVYPPVTLQTKQIPKENIILHVGRFRVKNVAGVDDYKKQGVMLESFKKMVDEDLIGKWKFVLAVSIKEDDKKKFAQLQESVKGYPVDFLINKSNDALWDAYNKAKIYWHASGYGEDLKKHPEFAEHFGISTVEAMGAGAVPVVINAGGQKEIVTDGENGFLWDTLADLSFKTKQLMDDPKLLMEMAEKAQMRAKDFSKAMFTKAIFNLVEQ